MHAWGSGDHREDFDMELKVCVGRPGAAVFRTRIQFLTEKCILWIPLSSDFLQIKGRKQIEGRVQKFGCDSKGLSAIESDSNLA